MLRMVVLPPSSGLSILTKYIYVTRSVLAGDVVLMLCDFMSYRVLKKLNYARNLRFFLGKLVG